MSQVVIVPHSVRNEPLLSFEVQTQAKLHALAAAQTTSPTIIDRKLPALAWTNNPVPNGITRGEKPEGMGRESPEEWLFAFATVDVLSQH
jgi:hypothetical protein